MIKRCASIGVHSHTSQYTYTSPEHLENQPICTNQKKTVILHYD
ncbi:hypothetical protein IMSAGC016_00417 [Muribaculaceae bacterium]|nr:hypothetical protein IMSAGC016_00417 [Muribaculaceae bacterium]